MNARPLGLQPEPAQPEVRESGNGGYTDAVLAAHFGAATGQVRAGATGGLQVAAGMVGRALATANVSGDLGLLTPSVLLGIGEDLVRAGQSMNLLRVDPDGRANLLRAGSVASVVYGEADPATWRYSLHMGGPSMARTVSASSAEVVHVRWNSDAYRPWLGRAPLTVAAATGRLAAELSRSLGNEASIIVGRLIPVAVGTGLEMGDNMRAALNDPAKGRVTLPETAVKAFGVGQQGGTLSEWTPRRLGADFPESAVRLEALVLQTVCGCCGIPAPLVPGANAAGPAMREGQRQLLTGTVQPLGRILEAEVSRVLERDVRVRFDSLAAADVAGRARGVHVLTQAGVDRDRALELVGWG